MTRDEYSRICGQLAHEAIAYAARMAEAEDPGNVTDEREHWIDVFLDEHLPDIASDAILSVTPNADAWMKKSGSFYATAAVRATAAFQADVWDTINRTEDP